MFIIIFNFLTESSNQSIHDNDVNVYACFLPSIDSLTDKIGNFIHKRV